MRFSAILFAPILTACVTQNPSYSTASKPPPEPEPEAQYRVLTAQEKATLGKMLAGTLKDPASAQWKWAPFPFPKSGSGNMTYCAQVNAKNSYGGYNGHKAFLAIVGVEKGKFLTGVIVGIQDNDVRYAEIVPQMCAEKGRDPYQAV
jgi:hypothetical protein